MFKPTEEKYPMATMADLFPGIYMRGVAESADKAKEMKYETRIYTGAKSVNMMPDLLQPLPTISPSHTIAHTRKKLEEAWIKAYGVPFGHVGMDTPKPKEPEPEPMPTHFDHPYFGRMVERRLKPRNKETPND